MDVIERKAAPAALAERIDALALSLEPKIIAWRRDLHAHPELGNREFRTSKLVAEHLRALGLEVQTAIAHTGVVTYAFLNATPSCASASIFGV